MHIITSVHDGQKVDVHMTQLFLRNNNDAPNMDPDCVTCAKHG